MSLFALPSFATSLVVLFFALSILSRSRGSPFNRTFAWMCLEFFTWQASWFTSYFLTVNLHRYLIVKVAFSSIVFLPVTALHFVAHSLQRWDKEKLLVKSLYIISLIFFILLWSTDLVVSGYRVFTWGIYGKAGLLHPLLVLSVVIALGRIHWLLSKVVLKGDGQITVLQCHQAKFTWLAFVLFSFAAVEFLINYGASFYPIGSFFILASFAVILYSITRYRFMDIKIFAFRGGAFTIVYLFVLGIPFWVGTKVGSGSWVIPVLLMAVFATSGPFIYNYIRRNAEDILLKEQRRYQHTLLQVSQGMTLIKELDKLLRLIVHVVARAVRIKETSIFLLDKETNRYCLKAVRYKNGISQDSYFDGEDPVVKYLTAHKSPIILEEIRARLQADGKANLTELEAIESTMERMKMAVVVPSFVQDALLGFMMLGEKSNGQMYTQDDLNVFSVLANQAALAIENAIFHEEFAIKLAKEFEDLRLKSLSRMGSDMSDKVNNRLNVISMAAGMGLMLLKSKGPQEELTNYFQKISENAQRGGEIARMIMRFGKPENFQIKEVDVPEVIDHVLKILETYFEKDLIHIKTSISQDPPLILIDTLAFEAILIDLLSNAQDAHTNKKDQILREKLPPDPDYLPEITLSLDPHPKEKSLLIEIKDNGVGMTEAQMNQLFLPYFTTKSSTFKGKGLGLGIIRQMLEYMKAKIDVESRFGRGTTITLTLPTAKEGAKDA